MMRCTELAKNGDRSVVEIRNMETDKVTQYVVCHNFDNSKTYGNKWDWGNYYNVDEGFGLYQPNMLRAAIFDLYDIKESAVSYKRAMEFARAFFNNMDIDSEQADTLKSIYEITEDEAEEFGIKDKLFPRKYKIVDVTFTRQQQITVKVVMPDDEESYNAEEYVENRCYLDDYDAESEDWECEDCNDCRTGLTEEEVNSYVDLDEIWNGCDFPDSI